MCVQFWGRWCLINEVNQVMVKEIHRGYQGQAWWKWAMQYLVVLAASEYVPMPCCWADPHSKLKLYIVSSFFWEWLSCSFCWSSCQQNSVDACTCFCSQVKHGTVLCAVTPKAASSWKRKEKQRADLCCSKQILLWSGEQIAQQEKGFDRLYVQRCEDFYALVQGSMICKWIWEFLLVFWLPRRC